MLKKRMVVLLAVFLSAIVLSGCIQLKISDSQLDKIADKVAAQMEPKATDKEPARTASPTVEPTPDATALPTADVTSAPTAETAANSVLYTNETLGFSLKFPRSWEGKFSISEWENGISVSFRPDAPVEEGKGYLFSLIKNPSEDDASFLDGAQYIESNGATYVYGGPTDVTYFEEDPEYDTFVRMRDEIDQVMKTLK